ncbi:hypothetical protein BDP81DRAFT_429216 [Colletotrichum phormii]|uniref:Uncharacterized protein n=1 Tax=Colletotrichum phormii TaxID=359342 RepID=A0AAI9ZST3_9PEZI|nr:uncharacterized protein BDP81DRAFT_429216 [Colletotrichum phormii]KAK1636194.1 hypothetical protein BDP81DRAFT_429216 [Colletotrichum phormii]
MRPSNSISPFSNEATYSVHTLRNRNPTTPYRLAAVIIDCLRPCVGRPLQAPLPLLVWKRKYPGITYHQQVRLQHPASNYWRPSRKPSQVHSPPSSKTHSLATTGREVGAGMGLCRSPENAQVGSIPTRFVRKSSIPHGNDPRFPDLCLWERGSWYLYYDRTVRFFARETLEWLGNKADEEEEKKKQVQRSC